MRRRDAARESPRDARLPRVEDRIRAGGQIAEPGGVGDLQVLGGDGGARQRAVRLLVIARFVPFVPIYSVSITRPCGSVF